METSPFGDAESKSLQLSGEEWLPDQDSNLEHSG